MAVTRKPITPLGRRPMAPKKAAPLTEDDVERLIGKAFALHTAGPAHAEPVKDFFTSGEPPESWQGTATQQYDNRTPRRDWIGFVLRVLVYAGLFTLCFLAGMAANAYG